MLCAAFVLTAGTLQAGAFISDLLFPSSAFDISNTHHLDAQSLGNNNFFSTAISQIPGVDETSVKPFSSGTSIQDVNSLPLPSIGSNWMDNAIEPAMNDPATQNVAMNSYQSILARTPNASNIFENTHLES